MPVLTRWVAAGSAAVLAGGLLLGGPAAVAAPEDAACAAASAQLDAALAATGASPAALTQMEETITAMAVSQSTYDALTEAAGGSVLAELNAVEAQREAAVRAGDAEAAQAAGARIDELLPLLYPLLDTPEINMVRASLQAGQLAFATLIKALSLGEATAENLIALALAQARHGACGTDSLPGSPGTPPSVPAEPAVPEAPVVPAAPAAPADPAPVAVNPGLNLQTAAAEPGPPAGLAAGLLAAGTALPVRALRRHRRLRA
ncbi:hypothetical protein [Kocuria sabuli]|uniref:hypothetical protein n=1 Tax=Kocuria sabuli TaxID=3071448 RepID=UPI0034D5A827